MDSLGGQLRAARERKKLTGVALAARINVKSSAITRWEKDRDHPSGKHLAALARELEIPLDHLVAVSVTKRPDAARFPQSPSVRSIPYTPTEADMEQLGPLWTRLVDIVKTREGVGKKEWAHIKLIVEQWSPPAVRKLPSAASGKSRK